MIDRRAISAIAVLVSAALLLAFVIMPNADEATRTDAQRYAKEYGCSSISPLGPMCGRYTNQQAREVSDCENSEPVLIVKTTFGTRVISKRDQCSEVTF